MFKLVTAAAKAGAVAAIGVVVLTATGLAPALAGVRPVPRAAGSGQTIAAANLATGPTTDIDTASAERNLLTGGSFENNAPGWTAFVPSGTGVVVNMVDYNTAAGAPAAAQDGSWYLAANTNTGGGGVYQDVPVSAAAGASYAGMAWLSAQSGTATGRLCLWGIGSSGSTSNCRSYSVTAGTYTPIQVVYEATASIGKVRFQLYPDANGGTTDMDTASLVQNLLQAGSFENSTVGWTKFVPSGSGVVVNLARYNTAAGAPATAQDGTWYLATNTNTGGGGVYQDVPVGALTTGSYVGTAWLAAQNGTATGKLCLWGIGSSASTSNCRSYSVTGSYTPIQVVYNTTASIATMRFQLYPDANGGTTDLDSASLAPNLLASGSFEGSASGWNPFIPAGAIVNLANYNTAAGAPATAQDGSWYLAVNTNTGGGGVYQDVPYSTSGSVSLVGTAWLAAPNGTATGQLCVWGLSGASTHNCRDYSVGGGYGLTQAVFDSPGAISTIRFQLYPSPN